MQLNNLKRNNKNLKRKRVGRGGKRGKTSGAGMKGQNSRAGNSKRAEIRDTIKKIPKLRGAGVHGNRPKAIMVENFPVNLSLIEKKYENGEDVNPKTLLEKKIISKKSGKIPRVKILAKGELEKKINVSGCLVSKKAKEIIEKNGGKVTD